MKKTYKKIISVFIAITLVLSTFAINSFAASPVIVISTEEIDHYQEDTFDVVISFPAMFKKFATLDLEMNYDTTNFELINVTLGDGLKQARNNQTGTNVFANNYNVPGSLEWILASSKNFEIIGDFAIVTFKVKKQTKNGKTPLSLNIKEALNDSHQDVSDSIPVQNIEINVIRNILADMKFTYNLIKNECTITQYNSTSSSEIIIPSKNNGFTIVAIGNNVFANHSEITSVHIPDTVTKISDCAFSGCSNLSELVLPETLKSIGDESFKSCGRLEKFVAPLYLETIGEFAFSDCYRLRSVDLNCNLKSIGEAAFTRCQTLSEVRISKATTSIGKQAFSNSLHKINFLTVEDNTTINNVIERDKLVASITTLNDINDAIYVPLATQQYHAEGATPDVDLSFGDNKLVNGTDYRIIYFNNKEIGAKASAVIIGMGEYGEALTVNFDIDCFHEWSTTTIKSPTCTSPGINSSVCIFCAKTKTDSIPAAGHKDSDIIKVFVLPTIYEEGDAYMLCDECKEKIGERIAVPKIYPDVTGDKLVNSSDALHILMNIVGLKCVIDVSETARANADTDGDGKITSLDALNVLNIAVGRIEIETPKPEVPETEPETPPVVNE